MAPEKHSVERGSDHDEGDEDDHDPGGSLVHFLSRQGSQISLGVESRSPQGRGRRSCDLSYPPPAGPTPEFVVLSYDPQVPSFRYRIAPVIERLTR